MKFEVPTAIKTAEGCHRDGPPAQIDVGKIVAIEPRENNWDISREPEKLFDIHLSTGAVITTRLPYRQIIERTASPTIST